MKRLRNIFKELRTTGSHPGLNRGPLTLAISALPPELWPPGDSQPSQFSMYIHFSVLSERGAVCRGRGLFGLVSALKIQPAQLSCLGGLIRGSMCTCMSRTCTCTCTCVHVYMYIQYMYLRSTCALYMYSYMTLIGVHELHWRMHPN